MSESVEAPRYLFKTRTNTELGARSISIADDGAVVFGDVVKQVTESMLTSYPRSLLGKWTPNRAALRYSREELAARKVRMVDTGKELELDEILALAR